MANMSYCRFQNTLADLRDCYATLFDDLSPEEDRVRQQLVDLCRRISLEFDGIEEEEEG